MTWEKIKLAPILLIQSGEAVYADRAIRLVKHQARELDPHTDIQEIDAQSYSAGSLFALASPSLFGERRLLIVPELESLNTALEHDLLQYLEHPEEDVFIVLRHNGGARGKKMLNALAKAQVPTTKIEAVKNQRDKTQAVMNDVRAAGRKMTTEAVGALIEAIGSDLRELLASVQQLLADVEGLITDEHVHTYFAGRIEAKGFNVADALIGGNVGQAVNLARHALATGSSPTAILGAIASKLRTMAQLLGQRSGVMDVKVSIVPWMADRAKRDMRGWSANGLAAAISAIAQADADVKGGSRDPGYALERGILAVGRARALK
ncbi:DNA polymerase III subunit delta [Arcanobacterium pinnipediorum]|uniref:DNA-directed DNA polymerase n=1 Tax=Arcanobacterium pinnipediorum TaxID=1503041 RepID=A0ABY5AEZ9_9ACTO|nr:DNA polymerase III subunit delta [Arcanobacterium pinnipediorum]USR78755.1 DNA polymerase III subunit delta [Arcanobacterium pinnipediorum]